MRWSSAYYLTWRTHTITQSVKPHHRAALVSERNHVTARLEYSTRSRNPILILGFCWYVPTFTQVINAALTLAARPQSKVAQDNMDVFKDQWEKQVRILTEAVDDITSVDDFLSVSGKVFFLPPPRRLMYSVWLVSLTLSRIAQKLPARFPWNLVAGSSFGQGTCHSIFKGIWFTGQLDQFSF